MLAAYFGHFCKAVASIIWKALDGNSISSGQLLQREQKGKGSWSPVSTERRGRVPETGMLVTHGLFADL